MIGREEIANRVKALDPDEIEIVVKNLPYEAMMDECNRRHSEMNRMIAMGREALKVWA